MSGADRGPPVMEVVWTPSQADFDLFAELSGDDNPIHVDPGFSAETRFGRTVAHGMLLYARVWAMISDMSPGRRPARQSLMFPAPSFAGEALNIRIAASETEANLLTVAVTRASDGETTLIGECRLGP